MTSDPAGTDLVGEAAVADAAADTAADAMTDPTGADAVADAGGRDAERPAGAPDPDDAALRTALEGLLVVLDRALEPAEAARAWAVPVEAVERALRQLGESYSAADRGIAVRETATGWRLFAAPKVAEAVRLVAVSETSTRLSVAALETLAVVAYRQPVSRSRVAAIRGVNVDAVMRTLTTRGLVDVVDRDAVTGAALYATTDAFLEAVGVRSLTELPDVAPLLPDVDTIEALSSEGST